MDGFKKEEAMKIMYVFLTAEVIEAIKDACDFLDVVADDRDNAYIRHERQEEVVKILEAFLIKITKM